MLPDRGFLGFSSAAGPGTVSLIGKETDEHRTSNVQHRTPNECILSILKKISRSLRLVGVLTPTPRRAIPSFVICHLSFDILRFAFLFSFSFIRGFEGSGFKGYGFSLSFASVWVCGYLFL